MRRTGAADTAVAADNINLLDNRRRPLAEINPLLAQISELPPEPNIEPVAYDYAGINLNTVAKEALDELDEVQNMQPVHNTTKENETNKQIDSLEVFESLIETLIEMDKDNIHNVQNIASTFIELKNLLENSNADSVSGIKQQLDELYKVALSIESKLKTEK